MKVYYLALVVVDFKKIKERVHAFLVMEHFSREVSVKELNSIPN